MLTLRGKISVVNLDPVVGAAMNERRPAVYGGNDGANATTSRRRTPPRAALRRVPQPSIGSPASREAGAEAVLGLQRSAGNRVVTALLQGMPPSARTLAVQRAVGFEFETGTEVMRLNPPGRSLSRAQARGRSKLPDKAVTPVSTELWNEDKVKLTGDQSADGTTHIEWVLEPPFDESDAGRVDLDKTMDNLKDIVDSMIAMANQTKIRAKTKAGDDKGWLRASEFGRGMPRNVLISPTTTVNAEP
jgi:hypothetical protein